MSETLRYRVEFDTIGLQSQLQQQRAMIGSSMGALMAAPGQIAGTGQLAFNTATSDLQAARDIFSSSFHQFPGRSVGVDLNQFPMMDPSIPQIGLTRRLGMAAGLVGAPPNAFAADALGQQSIAMHEGLARGAFGFGANFVMPTALGAGAAGLGQLVGGTTGALVGGIGVSMLAGAVGDLGMRHYGAQRDRNLILRSMGMANTPQGAIFSRDLAQEAGGITSEAEFSNVSIEEFNRFFATQATQRRLGAGNQKEITDSLDRLREDLRSVQDLRGALNLTFDEANNFLEQMRMAGITTSGGGGGPNVREFISQTRALGSFGFSRGQQQQIAAGAIQTAQGMQAAGLDPQAFLQNVGQTQYQAARLLQTAQTSRDPYLQRLARITPNVDIMGQTLQGAGQTLAGGGGFQQALEFALTMEDDPEEARAMALSALEGGPRGVAQLRSRAMREAGGSQAFGLRLATAQAQAGTVAAEVSTLDRLRLTELAVGKEERLAGRELTQEERMGALVRQGMSPREAMAAIAEYTEALKVGLENYANQIDGFADQAKKQKELLDKENELRENYAAHIQASINNLGKIVSDVGTDVIGGIAMGFEKPAEMSQKEWDAMSSWSKFMHGVKQTAKNAFGGADEAPSQHELDPVSGRVELARAYAGKLATVLVDKKGLKGKERDVELHRLSKGFREITEVEEGGDLANLLDEVQHRIDMKLMGQGKLHQDLDQLGHAIETQGLGDVLTNTIPGFGLAIQKGRGALRRRGIVGDLDASEEASRAQAAGTEMSPVGLTGEKQRLYDYMAKEFGTDGKNISDWEAERLLHRLKMKGKTGTAAAALELGGGVDAEGKGELRALMQLDGKMIAMIMQLLTEERKNATVDPGADKTKTPR